METARSTPGQGLALFSTVTRMVGLFSSFIKQNQDVRSPLQEGFTGRKTNQFNKFFNE